MRRYALKRKGEIVNTTQADSIDAALDVFFRNQKVDVDLDTLTSTHMTVRLLHTRKALDPYIIEELTQ